MDAQNEPHIEAILAEVRARRAAGEQLTDAQVLAAHPARAEALAAALQKLRIIRQARGLAAASAHASTVSPRASAPPAALAGEAIPGYEILREIHRGSQGVVYQALQKSTAREVAIKVIRHGPFADARDQMRFDREVRVLGALKHPNIVSIHDSGTAAGHAYFVMDYIEGEPLDAFAARSDCSQVEIARLFVKICDAVGAAQTCGIIHRDLKPGNIRIDRRGEPHVLDFGLAKIDPHTAVTLVGDAGAVDASEMVTQLGRGTFTQAGQFIGSLPWASPEQVEGTCDVDVRTDVYSLGVVLYQVIAGRFPYVVTGSLAAVIERIRNAPPVPPRSIRAEINDEIETIVLKCLQKERARRYQSAADLSADLQRYLRGEPIDAKRDSRLYVLRKQLRRYWLPLGAALAVFLSLIAGIVGTTRATLRALRAEADAIALAQAEARLREQADWESYRACLAAADAALSVHNTSGARERLGAAPPTLRGWEWRYLTARLDQSLRTLALPLPPGGRFALTSDEKTAFVILRDGRLIRLDLNTGDVSAWPVSADGVSALAVSRDGLRLALGMGSGEISLRRTADGQELLCFRAHRTGPISVLAFSHDDAMLASGVAWGIGGDSVRVWDAASGEPRAVSQPRTWVTSLAFQPGTHLLASGHTKTSAGYCLWDVERAEDVLAVNYEGLDVSQVEFSPDGTQLAVASQDSVIRVYDTSGRELRAITGHSAGVTSLAFNADGSRLVSSSMDQTLRVWDSSSGALVACRRGHLNPVDQVAFLGAGRRLLSASRSEACVKLWDAEPRPEPLTFDTGRYFVLVVAFSADGSRLFTNRRCWNTSTGALLAQLPANESGAGPAWVHADPALIWAPRAAPSSGGQLLHHDRLVVDTTENLLGWVVVSRAHSRAAIALSGGSLRVYGVPDGELLREWPIDPNTFAGMSFSDDAETLLTWTSEGGWSTRDVSSGRILQSGAQGTQRLVNATLSPDGRLVASASYDGAAHVSDALSGRELHVLRASGAPIGDQRVVWSVAFSPDGRRLATGSKDRRVRIWDVATGKELLALTAHAGTVMCLAWSPDGTQLASGGFDGSVCLWDSLPLAERATRAPE